MCLHALSYLIGNRPRPGPSSSARSNTLYIVISIALLLCLIIDTGVNFLYGQHMWIDDRNGPGGPTGYYEGDNAVWFNTWGSTMSVVQNILADGLLVWSIFWPESCVLHGTDERWCFISCIAAIFSMTDIS